MKMDTRIETEGAHTYHLTVNAQVRMQQRGVRTAALEACLRFGSRATMGRGALCITMGRQEAKLARREGVRIDGLEGLQLVVRGWNIVTVFRKASRMPRHGFRGCKAPRFHGVNNAAYEIDRRLPAAA